MHVHIIHQVGHLGHVLDDLVGLSRSISLREGKNISKRKIVLKPGIVRRSILVLLAVILSGTAL